MWGDETRHTVIMVEGLFLVNKVLLQGRMGKHDEWPKRMAESDIACLLRRGDEDKDQQSEIVMGYDL